MPQVKEDKELNNKEWQTIQDLVARLPASWPSAAGCCSGGGGGWSFCKDTNVVINRSTAPPLNWVDALFAELKFVKDTLTRHLPLEIEPVGPTVIRIDGTTKSTLALVQELTSIERVDKRYWWFDEIKRIVPPPVIDERQVFCLLFCRCPERKLLCLFVLYRQLTRLLLMLLQPLQGGPASRRGHWEEHQEALADGD